nr:MAG TPA: hypothetical protein [Caudoviricetes sp.]
MAYAIVRTDRLSGTKDPSQLKSVRYMGSGSAETAIENGNVVVLGDLTADREVYKALTPAASNVLDDLYLIASVEVNYDERKKNLNEFRNEVGGPAARAYKLHVGSEYSVTAEALDGTPKVNDFVLIQASTKLKASTAHTAGANAVGKIVAIETAGAETYYVIRVMNIATPAVVGG